MKALPKHGELSAAVYVDLTYTDQIENITDVDGLIEFYVTQSIGVYIDGDNLVRYIDSLNL